LKNIFLIVVISLVAVPLWADYGLSNVVTQQITKQNGQSPQKTSVQTPGQAAIQTPVPSSEMNKGTAVAVSDFKKTAFYPYTIHISSWQSHREALNDYDKKYRKYDMAFITKIDLGQTGIWYRMDYGAFASAKEAMEKMKELQEKGLITDPDAFIGSSVPYAVEIGTFSSNDAAMAQAQMLHGKGLVPYVMKESGDVYRLLTGAYPNEKSALPAREDLRSLGLQAKITKR
jgi:septal ring-binding cell division protein DamX